MLTLFRAHRPSLVDALLAGFLALVVLAEAFTEPTVQRPALHAAVGTTVTLAIAWRRTFPLPVALLVLAGSVFLGAQGGELSVVFGLLIMAFTIGTETEGIRSWLGMLLLLGFFLSALVLENRAVIPGDLGAGLVLVALPWVAGRTLRERAASLAEAMTRAKLLEEEKLHEAETAAVRERTRLARELHDVVSHSISVITIQVQAVRRRLGPDCPREAADLAAVESAARDAMAEMRRLFGVLRENGAHADLTPQPGLAELDRLVARVRDTGVHVEVDTQGNPVELSPGLDLAAYRIVQEAVTNALRHSDARHLRVRFAYAPGGLSVTVEDDGRGIDGRSREGHGLRGIRERAELYGGTLDVGPGDGGGTRVRARLPVGGHP